MSQRDDNTPVPDRSPAELAPLLSLLLDGQLNEKQRDKLQHLLRERADCRRYYLRFMDVHAATQWALGETHPQQQDEQTRDERYLDVLTDLEDDSALALAELARLHDEALKQPVRLTMRRKKQQSPMQGLSAVVAHQRSPRVIAMASLAALVALVGLTVVLMSPSSEPEVEVAHQLPEETAFVATLTDQQDAAWEDEQGGAVTLAVGKQLTAATVLTLTEGVAEVTTARGAVAILEAPAAFELLENNNALYLHAGKLVGLCHSEPSKGFVVHTEHADVVDLGTEFGVEVRDQQVTATVFTGEVELTTPGGMSQPLSANQTAWVTTEETRREVVIEDRVAEGFDELVRPAVVTDAQINLKGFEVRVVPRGVVEDVMSCTDRLHELNGIDERGLPAALRGGDLVMMPSDARPNRTAGTEGLKLTVDLAGPAQVYILYPHEHDPKHWLTRDYERTSMRVGHDRHNLNNNLPAGIGPGKSVDGQFIVWRRKATADGTAVIAGDMDRAMYAVIIQPAENKP